MPTIDGNALSNSVDLGIYEKCLTSAYTFPVVNNIFKDIGIKVGLFDYPAPETEPPPQWMRVLEGKIPIQYYESVIFDPNKVEFIGVVSSDYTGGKVCTYHYQDENGQRVDIDVYDTDFEDYESLSIHLPCSLYGIYYNQEKQSEVWVPYVFYDVPLQMIDVSTLSNGFRKHVPIPTQAVWNNSYIDPLIPQTIERNGYTYQLLSYVKTSDFEYPAVSNPDTSSERFEVRLFRIAKVFYPELDDYRPRTDSMQLTYFVKRRDILANPVIAVYDGEFVQRVSMWYDVRIGYERRGLLYTQEVTQYNTYYDLPLETILNNATYKHALFILIEGEPRTPLASGRLRAKIELGQTQLTIIDEDWEFMRIV